MSNFASLRAEWEDLLGRRPAYRDVLHVYGQALEIWESWSPDGFPVLAASSQECRARWQRGVALIVEAPPVFDVDALERTLEPILGVVGSLGEEEADGMRRFAAAWDEGRLPVASLLPPGRKVAEGAPSATIEISADLMEFVIYLAFHPPLDRYFGPARSYFSDDVWDAGHCPYCSAAPSFGDIGEDGKRWLSCGLCGGRWTIGRLRCPLCDNRDAHTLTRLAGEGPEEGYLVEACDLCRGYVKGVDRRLRWNAASPLIEDWGTPHLDLIARRKGYWRATPSLVQLVQLDSTTRG